MPLFLGLVLGLVGAILRVVIPHYELIVENQPVTHNSVYVKRLWLKNHGFLVMELFDESGERYFWGHSDFLPEGVYSDLNLEMYVIRKTQQPSPGRGLITLYKDNGDTFFSPGVDAPVMKLDDQTFKKTINFY
jgi:hypothetical protein